MKRYTIETPIETATGHQYWTVQAESEEEALAKFELGQCECAGEEVEVKSVGKPVIVNTDQI